MKSTGARAERWLRVRLYGSACVVTALFAAIGWKAYAVQIRDGARMRALGHMQYLKALEVPAPRGSIHDRRGVELAISVEAPSIAANPREVVDVARTAERLAHALGLDVRAVEAKLGGTGWFTWIERRVTVEEARRVEALGLPGVRVVAEPRRFYPARGLAGPLLGLVDIDGKGLEGLELALDDVLRGRRASLPALRDARGEVVLAGGWEETSTAGATVTLTIDRFIQYSAERALLDAVEEHQASAGVVIVLDPRTGEVLAMATAPTFDPNDPRGRKDARNRAVTDAFEPGSVMKVFGIAAAVDAGVVSPEDRIDVEGGRLQIGRKRIRDTHDGEHLITVTEIMKYSSNVGAVKIARKLGRERLYEALRRFGFGQKTGIELPGERAGQIRDPKRWGEIGLATISFGYGMTATPMQLAAALAAVANGGVFYAPTLVKRIVAADGKVLREHTPSGRRVLSEKAARQTVAMLKAVMEKGGTAEKVVVPGFVGAGKTGTAEKVDPATGKYTSDRHLSSFMGFIPADDPRLVILVMIDDPKGKKYFGGAVAGPVFARVAEESLKYLGVPPSVPLAAASPAGKATEVAPSMGAAGNGSTRSPESSGSATGTGSAPRQESVSAGTGVSAQAAPTSPRGLAAVRRTAPESVDGPDAHPVPAIEDELDELPPAGPSEAIVVIPDFLGMGMGEAIAAARAAGVRLEIEGSGRAVRQFPAPGRAMKSVTCRVTFDPG